MIYSLNFGHKARTNPPFQSIIGFTVLQTCAKHASHVPLIGGDFGPRENNIVQTCATAAGGMSNVFISAYPALYQLGLLRTPLEDFWRIATLTAVGGYFGFFFATPCKDADMLRPAWINGEQCVSSSSSMLLASCAWCFHHPRPPL